MKFFSAATIALAASVLVPASFALGQNVPDSLPLKVTYVGDGVEYRGAEQAMQRAQCISVYLKKDGDAWLPEITAAPEKRAALLQDEKLERVFACVTGLPGGTGLIAQGEPVPVNILTAYFFENCTDFYACDAPHKSVRYRSHDGWRFVSRFDRRKGYVAVNSAFLDKGEKDRNVGGWVNDDAIVRAASHPDLLKAYREQYFKFMMAQANRTTAERASVEDWVESFGLLGSDEGWRIVAPKMIAADAVAVARRYATPERFAELQEQARAYWQDKYRAEWAPYRHAAVTADNVAAFDELARRTPAVASDLAFRLVDFDKLAPLARSKVEQFVAAQQAQAAAAENARAKAQAERMAALEKKTAAWRKALKAGAATNCGPILEMKGQLVKVYAPVKDYGNEHWLDRGTLYMPGEECFFLNGAYRPPYRAAAR